MLSERPFDRLDRRFRVSLPFAWHVRAERSTRVTGDVHTKKRLPQEAEVLTVPRPELVASPRELPIERRQRRERALRASKRARGARHRPVVVHECRTRRHVAKHRRQIPLRRLRCPREQAARRATNLEFAWTPSMRVAHVRRSTRADRAHGDAPSFGVDGRAFRRGTVSLRFTARCPTRPGRRPCGTPRRWRARRSPCRSTSL